MKAIETLYDGYRFRSRLEARWAVFFDQCGIVYRYEPEAYDLSGVICTMPPESVHGEEAGCCCSAVKALHGATGYLPDFFLENVGLRTMEKPGVFFEVKGRHDEQSDAKALLLGHLTDTPVVIAACPPLIDGGEGLYQIFPWWDNSMQFMRCLICQRMKIEFYEGNYMYCSHCQSDATNDHPVLVHAAMASRGWRFEPRKETP